MELPWIYVDIIEGRLNLIGWLLSAISSNPTDRTYWPVLNLRVAYFGQYPALGTWPISGPGGLN
jgi:hypothetical protein